MMRKKSQPPASPAPAALTRREREIMDILYRRGRATAAEVLAELADPPGNSAIRTLLTLLERKGRVRHESDGPRYVYLPTEPAHRARRHALRQLVTTFFAGSSATAAAALLETGDLSREELDHLAQRIERARGTKE